MKVSHDEPDVAVVIDSPDGESVSVVYANQLENNGIALVELTSHCEANQLKTYSYAADDLAWAE